MKHSFYRKVAKRILDVLLSFVSIILLSPVFFVISITNLIFLGWPIFFVQERAGKNNKPFKLIKFKSMKNCIKGKVQADEERLTKYGKIIRSTSLDELPELFNIFLGKMSFIGPRPLLVEYIPLYDKNQIRRHEVLPGLTGYAQINGRNLLSWKDKFKYDVYYVDNLSFGLDVKIFFKTFLVVFEKKGISQSGRETADKFKGNIDE